MSLLFETIRCENGQLRNLDYHQERMNYSWKALYGMKCPWKLEDLIRFQELPHQGLYRCRVSYDAKNYSIAFYPYQKRSINSIKLIENANLSYSFKFEDRSVFSKLSTNYRNVDEIVFTRNGFLTDSSFSNLVLRQNQNWYTPETFLLRGTKRQQLLNQGIIKEKPIHVNTILEYDAISFINAMLDPGDMMFPISILS